MADQDSRRARSTSGTRESPSPEEERYANGDVERGASRYGENYKQNGSARAYVVPSETPATRKAKRDSNLLAKKTRAALRLQAAFRGMRARKAAKAKAEKPYAASYAEFHSNLEPYIATAFATCIAVQWDDAIERIIGFEPDKPGFAVINAVGITLYASLCYLALMCVGESMNKRLLNLIKQSLQILVGWMWKAVVVATDENIAQQGLQFSPMRERWIQAGYMLAYSLIISPVFVGAIVLLMQTSKTNEATFTKQFSGLMLGASALMIGYSWHQTLVHASNALIEDDLNSLLLRLVAAVLRSTCLQLLLGLIRFKTPLANASKVHKGPKPEDSLGKSFWDSSVFVGGRTLSFICGFSWFSIVQALAALFAARENGWGSYIVYTVFVFFFLGFASLLALLGAPRALCCPPVNSCTRVFANGELIFYSTIAIQLGWATQNSYKLLIRNVEVDTDRRDVIAWALGSTLMLSLWLLIIFLAVFGRVKRTRKQEQEMAQM